MINGSERFEQNTQPKLSFFRNRFYDQETGRWTQEDPIGVAGGVNLYQFNGNNPVSYSDPFGLAPESICPPCVAVAVAEGGAAFTAGEAVVATGAVALAGAMAGAARDATGIGGAVVQQAGRLTGKVKEFIASVLIALGGGKTDIEVQEPPPVVREEKPKKPDEDKGPPVGGE